VASEHPPGVVRCPGPPELLMTWRPGALAVTPAYTSRPHSRLLALPPGVAWANRVEWLPWPDRNQAVRNGRSPCPTGNHRPPKVPQRSSHPSRTGAHAEAVPVAMPSPESHPKLPSGTVAARAHGLSAYPPCTSWWQCSRSANPRRFNGLTHTASGNRGLRRTVAQRLIVAARILRGRNWGHQT
jgi:hypothetical protein